MKKREVLSVVLFCLVAIGALSSPAAEDIVVDDGAIVRYDGLPRGAAAEVFRIYPVVRAELLKDLGWEVDFRPEILLVKDSASFRKAVGSDLVTAVAFPGQNRIVIDYARMGAHPFSLEVTLKHELCHLQIHRRIAGEKVPRWLDEGICQWVTGGFGELISDRSRSVLMEAVLAGRVISLERLANGFPSEGPDLLLAYEESRSVIDYVSKEYGPSGVREILAHMASGAGVEEAVSRSLLLSLSDLERRWRASLSPGTAWLLVVRDNLYELLFAAAALLTVYGFIKVLKRKREYKDDDEDSGGDGENS